MEYIKKAKERITSIDKETRDAVSGIIDQVRERGDEAVIEYSEKYDGSTRRALNLGLRVGKSEIEEAYQEVSQDLIKDMAQAAMNILAFAEAQKMSLQEVHDFSPRKGVFLGHRIIPIDSCLCYIPGGNYPLYSTALMLIIPAKEAGVKRVVACSPVEKGTGKINPKTLVAMDIAGADEIYAIGGTQAIAAAAYGTESILPVDLIVGPGNKYVAEAKRQCYGQVGIDFVAGPSEVLVIADGTGSPEIVAADLLAQAEHDVNAKSILVVVGQNAGESFAEKVIEAVEAELETLDTADIARVSWENNGEVILAESKEEAIFYANQIAPEHLELNIGVSALTNNPANSPANALTNNPASSTTDVPANSTMYKEESVDINAVGLSGEILDEDARLFPSIENVNLSGDFTYENKNNEVPADIEYYIKNLTNYGSLFIGQNTAEVFGDYASGPNHTLPTVKASRYTGGLWVGTFLKTCTYQYMSDEGSSDIAPIVERLAKGEGLTAHSIAAKLRK